jgi:hypothetical protein
LLALLVDGRGAGAATVGSSGGLTEAARAFGKKLGGTPGLGLALRTLPGQLASISSDSLLKSYIHHQNLR